MLGVNLEPIIKDRNIIKKGFKNSIGWNLGMIEKSIHLFDPFTSAPNNGTNNKDTKKITNKMWKNIGRNFGELIHLKNYKPLNCPQTKIIDLKRVEPLI